MAFEGWEAKNLKARQCQSFDRPHVVPRLVSSSELINYLDMTVSINAICLTAKKAAFRPEGFLK